MQIEENQGYILKVSHDDWVEQIFELKKDYSGIIRNWRVGTPIFLAKKKDAGDSFLGYGVTEKVEMLWTIIHKSVVNSLLLCKKYPFQDFVQRERIQSFGLSPQPNPHPIPRDNYAAGG